MSLERRAGGDCDGPEMTSENRKPNSRGRRVGGGGGGWWRLVV